jgi:hypothetical protein
MGYSNQWDIEKVLSSMERAEAELELFKKNYLKV